MAFFDWLAWLLRILWAVRISVINVVLSLLAFGFAVQAQNLMADLSSMGNLFAEITFWLGVFGFTFLLWAFPVHYGARRTLEDPAWVLPRALYAELKGRCVDEVHAAAEEHEILIRWLPRILGLMPFVALALGIHGALSALEGANDLPETALTRQQGYWLYGADAVAAISFLVFVCFRTRIIPASWTGSVLHPAAMVVTAVLFAIAYVAPIEASVILPRALLVPPLFGSLVLFLSWLQRLGHRTGFPYLTVLTAAVAVATGLNVDFNRIRTLPDHENERDQRLTVMDAFGKWTAANPCRHEKRGDGEVEICPRPLIIAIDGGASRAAFTAATFIGDVLDRVPAAVKGEAASPGRRIFAMSGVSGGSYGAAVVRAALADSQAAGPSASPPCRSAQSTWFGFEHWKTHGKSFTWRQCLQALTSGDNLSATIIGLAFRDYMAPPWQAIGLPAMPDRAALLEMTFERQYSATLAPELRFFEGGDACGPNPGSSGLCLPAAHPQAFFEAHGTATDVWVPMLLLNGTSVATGRRIISSDFKPADSKSTDSGKGSGPLYAQAYDLREAMSKPCDHEQGVGDVLVGTCQDEKIHGPDVRLSTAAVNSARFPLISPAGIFDMHRDRRYGDQIVDGGYFENSGLTSAMDIVAVLRANGVKPILVSISNDPVRGALTEKEVAECAARHPSAAGPAWRGFCTGLPRRRAPTPRVLPEDNTFLSRVFGILSRPFQALVATGNGHGDEALGIAASRGSFHHLQVQVKPQFNPETWPQKHDPTCDEAAHKKVHMANVSMSWWLAASAQADLDIQRCSDLNQAILSDIIAAADGGPDTSP